MSNRDDPAQQVIYPIFERFVLRAIALTPYGVLRSQWTGMNRKQVEFYVLSWQAAVLIAFVLSTHLHRSQEFMILAVVVSATRLVEIITTLLRHYFLWFPERTDIPRTHILSARRSLLMLLMNYGEIVVIFATFYVFCFEHGQISFKPGEQYGHLSWLLLHESLVGMVGNSTGLVLASSRLGWFLFILQPLTGFLILSVVLGQVLNGLPQARSMHPDEIERARDEH